MRDAGGAGQRFPPSPVETTAHDPTDPRLIWFLWFSRPETSLLAGTPMITPIIAFTTDAVSAGAGMRTCNALLRDGLLGESRAE